MPQRHAHPGRKRRRCPRERRGSFGTCGILPHPVGARRRGRSPRHGLSHWLLDGYGRRPADLRGWQRACGDNRVRMRRTRMPDLVRRYIAVPQVPVKVLLSGAGRTATAVAESMKMSPDRIDEVRMAVVEACINALEHSHSSEREVYVT